MICDHIIFTFSVMPLCNLMKMLIDAIALSLSCFQP